MRNILILGLGSIGQRHLRNLNKLDKGIKFFAYRKKFNTPALNNNNKVLNSNLKKNITLVILKISVKLKNLTLTVHLFVLHLHIMLKRLVF